MNEKLLKVIGITIGVFVVLLIILFAVASCSSVTPKLENVDEKMVKIAKDYYENHKDELPSEDKDTKTYTLSKMIEEGKISDPSTEDASCSGEVVVTNNNGNFLYSPFLRCGKAYEDVLLSDKLIDEYLVTEGHGLYQIGNQYVFRGENVNNYLEIAGEKFRIIRINEDGTIRVIQTTNYSSLDAIAWDDRYNESRDSSEGNNDFYINSISSRIKEAMENAYKTEGVISDDLKPYLTTHEICFGKRTTSDSTKDGSTECSIKLSGAPVSGLTTYEYLLASIDQNCNRAEDYSCSNYNYLANYRSSFWTITADASNTYKAFQISSSGIRTSVCNNRIKILLTYNLDDKLIFVDGDGTIDNPYQVI